jgi:hypothetical protein
MRKFWIIISIIFVGIWNVTDVRAQETSDSETHKLLMDLPSDIFSGNFAVPDAPAFMLLSKYPSNILRPIDVKDFAVGLADLWGSDNNGFAPKSFAVEFSPALLIKGKNLNLKDYQKHSWIYRTRISAATHRPEGEDKATRVSIGIRFSLIDDSDLRNNIDYISDATHVATEINEIQVAARKRLGPDKPLKLTPKEEKQIEEIISDYKKKKENEKWNKRILEFAFAASSSSSDSQDKSLRMDKIAGWSTYGHPISTWGQVLIGLNFGSEKDALNTSRGFETTGSLSTRLYVGRNQYKIFFEGQVSLKEERKSNYLFNGGGEVNLFANIWLVFSAGAEYLGSVQRASLETSFQLKYGL